MKTAFALYFYPPYVRKRVDIRGTYSHGGDGTVFFFAELLLAASYRDYPCIRGGRRTGRLSAAGEEGHYFFRWKETKICTHFRQYGSTSRFDDLHPIPSAFRFA